MKKRELVSCKAKQIEYQYFSQKIKNQLQYAKLLPETLSHPARQDLEEISAIYQATGSVPEAIHTDTSLQLSLLRIIKAYYTNQRLLRERKQILQKVCGRITEEKALLQKFESAITSFLEEKPAIEESIKTLQYEIGQILGPKSKEYAFKEYVAKLTKVEGAYTHESMKNFSLNTNREAVELAELENQVKIYKNFPTVFF